MKRKIIYKLFILIALFFVLQNSNAQKTDTIMHINGDLLTGELKKMVYGVATWSMDGMGTISVEEPKINSFKSKKLFEIKMKSGEVYFGSFDTSHVSRTVIIVAEEKRTEVSISDIVEIYPIKNNFWMRTTANLSLGGNLSKGGQVATIDLSGNVYYRKEKSYVGLSWDDNNTFQGDSLTSTKADIGLDWQRILKNKWSGGLLLGVSQNTELGYKHKYDFSVLGIRDISYNDWNRFYVGAGFSLTRETPYDNSASSNDVTAIIQVVWKVFKYTSPKVWVDANINLVPYLTGEPRYRTVFNLNPQVSLFSDNFKVGFIFYNDFDSSPASTGASTTDYGTTLQLTYSLH